MTVKAVIVSPSEYGIEENKANELVGNLPQILKEREPLSDRFDSIIKLDIEDQQTTKQAKELRLLIQKNRTKGIMIWHKTTKEFFLKGGQFVDAIKRKEIAVNERMEAELLSIEKHAELKEQKRLKELQLTRAESLGPYVDDCHLLELAGMADDVWEAYYTTKVKQHEERVEAEKKAEAERIAKEKEEAEERERIRIENERLKKEADEREKQLRIEAQQREDKERKRQAKEEAERKKLEAARKKQEAALQAKLKKELEAKQKLEAEIKAKAEAEKKAKAEAEEAERKAKEEAEQARQRELEKGDEDKVTDLINDLDLLKGKYQFDSKTHKALGQNVDVLIEKIIKYIDSAK